jgi:hypothetical protein
MQEKDSILRELEKVYKSNRELAFENITLRDESSFMET